MFQERPVNKDTLPLVLFSTQAWSDLWVSKHWIAHEFARERAVLFVEPPARADVMGDKFSAFASTARQIEPNLWALRLVSAPFPYRVPSHARLLWRWPMHRQLRRAVAELGFEEFDVLTFDPHCQPLLMPLKERIRNLMYYAVDPPLGSEDSVWPERRLVRDSDAALAVTQRLADLLATESGRSDIQVVPHGIASAAAQPTNEESALPEAFSSVDWDRPVIGYTGAIHDVYVDFALIRDTARAHPDWQFVMIGPYSGSDLSKKGVDIRYFDDCPNVIFCGAVPFAELSHAIQCFDVCIVPYRADIANNWERRSPFKILHYFVQGKPVVMANVPALDDYPAGSIYSYESQAGFVSAITDALAECCKSGLSQQRKAIADERSFDKLFAQIAAHL